MKNERKTDILLHLNTLLSSYRNFNTNMPAAMRLIGEISHHDRIHIVEIHRDMTLSIVYEWCDRSLPSFQDEIKNYRMIYDARLQKQLYEHDYIKIDTTYGLENNELGKVIGQLACRKSILLPLFESGSHLAFIAFMQCQEIHEWTEEEIKDLGDFASIIAINLDRFLHIRRLSRHLSHKQQEEKNVQLLKVQLKQVHSDLIPSWEQLLDSSANPVIREYLPEIKNVDEHIRRLDNVCQTIFVK